MQLQKFFDELRDMPVPEGMKHKFAKPISTKQIEEWEAEHPGFVLPETYKSLLQTSDGIVLRYRDDSPRGLLTILPLVEVKPLAEQIMEMCGLEAEDLTDPPTCLMIGE